MGQTLHQIEGASGGQVTSRVWRVEIRAGKSHLKDQWNLRSWADLDVRLGDLATAAIIAVRHTTPNKDTNRSRWPESFLWKIVTQEIRNDLFEMRNFAPADTVKRVHKEAHLRLLARQSMGLFITRAALSGISAQDLPSFTIAEAQHFADEFTSKLDEIQKKLQERAARYDLEN